MATRMQQRRGTASQWVSTNAGAGPILNAGEIGWESDTNKFKIGDGVNNWSSLDYFADINSTVNPAFGTSITFEGATADSYETTLQVTDPTADRTITFPDSSGTVALTTDIAAGTVTESGTQTLTNKTLTSPVVSGLTLSDSGIVIEGSSADAHETTLTVTNPTADRTITFPDETGTVALVANVAALSGATFTGAVSGTDLTLSGNLTVNGTTTNINSTNLVIEDKNIILGDTGTPTDTTADGGGITLKGATDKTFNWVDATDSWTSSEHLTLSATKELRLADTDSSHYVGFKAPSTVSTNRIWTLPAADGASGQVLTTDGSGTFSFSTPAAGAAFSEMMLIGA